MSFIRNIWKDPVWSKLIAAGLIALCVFIYGYRDRVISVFDCIIEEGSADVTIQKWVLLLPCLILIVSLAVLAWAFSRPSLSNQQKDEVKNKKNSYNKDEFFNLKWSWKYLPGGEPFKIKPICPKCSYELTPHDVNVDVFYTCADCSFKSQRIGASDSRLNEVIVKKIQKNQRLASEQK